MIDLNDRVILITGASRGIGRRAAEMLVEAGARTDVNYSRSRAEAEELVQRLGSERALAIQADVADPEEARRLVAATLDHYGRIDVLVNNAATFAENRFDSTDYAAWQDGWRRTMELNLYAPANLFYLCYPHMRASGGGKVINVSSRAAFRGETEFADYGASKAALVNLTKSIARACGPHGIVASCVAPGFVATEMAAEEIARNGADIVAQIPLGRVATVDDVAGVILFLASPLGDYLNGATIDVNGGSYVR